MTNVETKSRMFQIDGKRMTTWNIHIGCTYGCTYCSAKNLALTRLKNVDRYRDGFKPRFVEEELERTFKPGEWVFVSYMGDISFARKADVIRILNRIREFPETNFLFCTKHPLIYWFWPLGWPENVYFGATIETTEDYGLSQAPIPRERARAMSAVALEGKKKFISIEPVMDFDLKLMLQWMEEIKPAIIEVGADNYHNKLSEPSPAKIQALLKYLRQICPVVVEKEGLERLKSLERQWG